MMRNGKQTRAVIAVTLIFCAVTLAASQSRNSPAIHSDVYIPSVYKLIFGDNRTDDVSIQKTAANQITVTGNLSCTGATCGNAGTPPITYTATNTDGIIINPSNTGQGKNLLKVGDGGSSTIFNVVGSGGAFGISMGGAFQANVTLNGALVAGGTLSLTGTGACSSFSATAGGSWAGSATCSGTSGAATVTITPGTTAPHFWSCFGSDITIAHTLAGSQSGFSNTACTINFTSVTSTDNVQITAFAY